MLRLCIEIDEKAWEKLMWALEHEEPIKWEPDPVVKEWVRALNDPKKVEERANAINELIRRTYASEENNKR